MRDEILEIDASRRAVTTGSGTIEADRLVVALGAASRPDLVPGLAVHGHDVWDVGRARGRRALSRFEGGRILVLVAARARTPAPPAPYECAIHVDESLRVRDLRDRTELAVSTVQPMLMPNAGKEGSAWMGESGSRSGASTTGRDASSRASSRGKPCSPTRPRTS